MKTQKRKATAHSRMKRYRCEFPVITDAWIAATKIHNYAAKDPFLDWCDLHGPKDKADIAAESFAQTLKEKGVQFESEVVQELARVFSDDFEDVGTTSTNVRDPLYQEKTYNLIKEGKPIIYSGLLADPETKTFGIPDLIVRTDYLSKICPQSSLPNEDQDQTDGYKYVIVDMKNTTVTFRVDGARAASTGSIPFYKCQLYIYTQALNRYQRYQAEHAYLLTKGYHFDDIKHIGWDSRLAQLDFSETRDKTKDIVEKGLEWYRKVSSEGSNWDPLKPVVPEMYPNMCNNKSCKWLAYKKTVAEELKEITLLWRCGPEQRAKAHAHGITTYDHPDLTVDKLGFSTNAIATRWQLQNILEVNKIGSDKVMTWEGAFITVPSGDVNLYVDFETRYDEDDDTTMVYNIGVSHMSNGEFVHKAFVAADYTQDEERKLFLDFFDYIKSFNSHDVKLFHYGHHELTTFNKVRLIHEIVDEGWDEIDPICEWVDLYKMLCEKKFAIRGALDLSLKSLASAFYENGCINTSFANSPVDNGADSLLFAEKALEESECEGCPLTETSSMKSIVEYNRLDCQVLLQITERLRSL